MLSPVQDKNTRARAGIKRPVKNGLETCSNSKAFNSQHIPNPPSDFKAEPVAQNFTKSILAKSVAFSSVFWTPQGAAP